jgi:hypothetical protein
MAARMRVLTPDVSPAHRLGAEVRRLRMAAGISLAELGRRIWVSADLIRKVEVADRFGAADVVGRLDQALDAGGVLIELQRTSEAVRAAEARSGTFPDLHCPTTSVAAAATSSTRVTETHRWVTSCRGSMCTGFHRGT